MIELAGAAVAETQLAYYRKDIFFRGNSLAIGDFDGDSRPDLVVGGEGSVKVLLNSGNGSFGPPIVTSWLSPGQVPGAYTNPAYLSTGDFNRDGKSDLIVTLADPLGVLVVRLGRGDGTFLPPVELDLGPAAVGDFNSDGTPDLVTVYGEIWLGNGDGSFRNLPRSTSPGSVVVADFNRDGKDDFALGQNYLSVFLGRGDGTYDPPVISQIRASSLLAADLNRDGLPDLVTQSGTALGKGDGRFEPLGCLVIPGAQDATPLAAEDLTGDGVMDVALSSSLSPSAGIWIFPGKGDGTFGLPVRQMVAGSPGWGAADDFDGDGRLDFVTVNRGSNTISLLLSRTDNRDSLVRGVSSASGTAIVAPGSLATLYNSFSVAVPASAAESPWPTRLAGFSLEIRDSAGTSRLAPLLYVSDGQVNFLVPPDTSLGEAALFVAGDSGSKPVGTIDVDAVAPGVFAIVGRFPAAGGGASDDRIVSIYATGFRGANVLNLTCGFQDLMGIFVNAPCTIEHFGSEGVPGLDRFDIRVPASVVRYLSTPPTWVYPVDVTLGIDGILANSVALSSSNFH